MKKIVLLKLLILTTAVTFAAAETADTVGLNGRIVHEEALAWDPPGEPIQFDACGSDEPALDHAN